MPASLQLVEIASGHEFARDVPVPIGLGRGNEEALVNDPYELHNRARDPAIADTEASLESTLQTLLSAKPVDTPVTGMPSRVCSMATC